MKCESCLKEKEEKYFRKQNATKYFKECILCSADYEGIEDRSVIESGFKECSECGEIKEAFDFYSSKAESDGFCKKCKVCSGGSKLKNSRGINKYISGFIYVISNPAWSEWVKIGRATSPEDRLSSYQTGSPLRDYSLEYSLYVEDTYVYEKYFNDNYSQSNSGEWYMMSINGAIEIIESIKNGAVRRLEIEREILALKEELLELDKV